MGVAALARCDTMTKKEFLMKKEEKFFLNKKYILVHWHRKN